ncbi:MAG TPA: Y-family DNA polymerase [Patescibacteria group bacterium]|nr:Y-family DNA polymerase [Patescibacteria group bacterium]
MAKNDQSIFALIDCNNFFVSCERIFRPDLEGKPVVVLSSNDGCAVARSNEAKKLGIPMGAPAFKYKYIFNQHKVTTFSANFEIYGDISKRITALLATITPKIEVYSVDESFLDLSELLIEDYEAWGRAIRAIVLKNIGVPVSIGIAPTKTLAKLASEIAKKNPEYNGAMSFNGAGQTTIQNALEKMPVREVWGVGRRLAPKLCAEGVNNALQLAQLRPQHAQQLMGVHGRQLVAELNGISCLPLDQAHDAAQSILRSRTFGEDTNQQYVLEAAVATLAAQGAFKLRCEKLLASRIGVFANTNRHKPGYRRWMREIKLDTPTADTGQIISLLIHELNDIFLSAQQYHRLGIFLYDLAPETVLQTDLFGKVDGAKHDTSQARMQAIDRINKRHGKGKIYYASQDLSKSWQPKQQIRSPRYVSSWDELPEAHIAKNA